MRKSTKLIKRFLALFLVVLMSIETFAAVVGDNDGAAFITKAEFDSLKNTFQAEINRYNNSLDNKIDGAISSYLEGVKVSKYMTLQNEYAASTKNDFKFIKDWSLTGDYDTERYIWVDFQQIYSNFETYNYRYMRQIAKEQSGSWYKVAAWTSSNAAQQVKADQNIYFINDDQFLTGYRKWNYAMTINGYTFDAPNSENAALDMDADSVKTSMYSATPLKRYSISNGVIAPIHAIAEEHTKIEYLNSDDLNKTVMTVKSDNKDKLTKEAGTITFTLNNYDYPGGYGASKTYFWGQVSLKVYKYDIATKNLNTLFWYDWNGDKIKFYEGAPLTISAGIGKITVECTISAQGPYDDIIFAIRDSKFENQAGLVGTIDVETNDDVSINSSDYKNYKVKKDKNIKFSFNSTKIDQKFYIKFKDTTASTKWVKPQITKITQLVD